MNKTNTQQPNAHQPQTDQQKDTDETSTARNRQAVLLGLEVALALAIIVAQRVWHWAREERIRSRVDRSLRDHPSAT